MSLGGLTQKIKEQSRSLGFEKVGIIPAQVLQDEAQHLNTWLAQGYQADMDWMERHSEKRLDPAALVPGAKSIICVAMNYYVPDGPETSDLKFARYARGKDYHKLIRKRLGALLSYIQERCPQAQGRPFTDSAPLLERALAVRAGIGWQGKNTNMLSRDYGSWLFLGELILDIELDYDTPEPMDHCGSCTRCLDACPTDVFEGPKVLDANKCIAYWTIENADEELPGFIAENLNGWAFGCDICQDVCPWNIKFAQVTKEAAFQPRAILNPAKAERLLALDEQAFSDAFQNSPIRRTGLRRLKRNIGATG